MIDLDTVRARFMAARTATEEANQVGLDSGRLQALLDSWNDVGPLHDEVKRLRPLEAALHGIVNDLPPESPAYGYAWKALYPRTPRCSVMDWPEKYSAEKVQCPNWSTAAEDGIPRCGRHLAAHHRELAIIEQRKRGETWEASGYYWQEHEHGEGAYKQPIAGERFDNQIEAEEAAETLRRRFASLGAIVRAKRLTTNEMLEHGVFIAQEDHEAAGRHFREGETIIGTNETRERPEGIDDLHDPKSVIDGAFSRISLTNYIVDDSHSLNVIADGSGTVKITCNDCDFEWEGEKL